ncbi:MAG TPA: CbiX/SirB N-terminal domain-containing protein [Burkholderiales bacterium]|nr:CbiX/SirB N-terminal domain-containing protein [Burkholderiales bacterium]HXJ09016.1 CbiX/SirB N-terminal domain-containing protein [Burkholderiales bacterium]
MRQGLVLFAHGSSDPQWAQPFERIALSLQKKLPAVAVVLAFLEHGTSLEEAIAALAAKGAGSIRVVPVFFGQGGHLKKDLPSLMAQARRAFPGLDLVQDTAIGENPAVIEAIAAVIAGR